MSCPKNSLAFFLGLLLTGCSSDRTDQILVSVSGDIGARDVASSQLDELLRVIIEQGVDYNPSPFPPWVAAAGLIDESDVDLDDANDRMRLLYKRWVENGKVHLDTWESTPAIELVWREHGGDRSIISVKVLPDFSAYKVTRQSDGLLSAFSLGFMFKPDGHMTSEESRTRLATIIAPIIVSGNHDHDSADRLGSSLLMWPDDDASGPSGQDAQRLGSIE